MFDLQLVSEALNVITSKNDSIMIHLFGNIMESMVGLSMSINTVQITQAVPLNSSSDMWS